MGWISSNSQTDWRKIWGILNLKKTDFFTEKYSLKSEKNLHDVSGEANYFSVIHYRSSFGPPAARDLQIYRKHHRGQGKKKHQLSPMFGIPKLGIWLAFQLLVLHCFWIPFFFDIGFVWTLVYQQMWWINGISHSIPIRIFMAIQQKHMYPLVNYRNYGKSPFLMGKSTINGHFP
jgi:hypothetical protein